VLSYPLIDLPSTFYRVAVKALITNEAGNLLLQKEEDSTAWDVPGGGWEYGETLEECIGREVKEELGVEVASIGPIAFIVQTRNLRDVYTVRIGVPVSLASYDMRPGTEVKYIDEDFDPLLRIELSDVAVVLRYYQD
jgi:ADP-ribose pyrophosphatase YjhB (NUDIX family)